jgi:hypothetical protein
MTNPKLNVSSELLSNYKAATIMPADAAFSALQTTEGHALLFSIGTDGICYLTQESPGAGAAGWQTADLKAGWRKTDLSSALAASGVTGAKKVAVAQNTANSNVHMALAASTEAGDLLHVSLDNSASDTSWTGAPAWMPLKFDDGPAPPFGGPVVISNIFISEAADGEYIVVDLLQQSNNTIFRYFIDPTKSLGTNQVWNQHPLDADIDASTASTVHGRRTDGGVFDTVDGLYTMGSIGGQAQLTYRPLYDPTIAPLPNDPSSSPFAPGNQPPPSFLLLPNQAVPTAIAAVRRDDGFTDLFVASGNTIYLFTAENQDNRAQGVVAFSNPMVAGVKQLFGYRSNENVILWGLSAGSDNTHSVFYTTCPIASIGTAAAWSVPLPLLTGVHSISPLVNKANNANNFFAHSGVDTLQRAMQAPDTTTWNHHDIPLQPPANAKATRASAFTTRVQVNDANGQPLANTAVQISALHRVGVDINGFYQVLDTAPVSVRTDARGALNIIEWVKTPRGTPLTITHPDGTTAAVNPMTNMLKKATKLATPDNPNGVDTITADHLNAIRVPNKDGTLSDRPLIATGANAPSSGDVAAAAAAMTQLATIHASLPADGSVQAPKTAAMTVGVRKITVGQVHAFSRGNALAFAADISFPEIDINIGGWVGGAGSWLGGLAGDVFSALEQATDYAVALVEDTETGIWHFAATIGGETYAFVLDAAEKVVGAVVAIYNAIKTFIEDLIAWLEFLLEWGDFKRSMHVCKQVVWMSLHYLNDHAEDLKPAVDNLLADARGKVDDWAGVKNSDSWAGKVDNPGKPPGFVTTLFDVSADFSGPAMFFFNHFVDGMLSGGGPDDGTDGGKAYEVLEKALDNQADTMVAAIAKLEKVVLAFPSQSLEDTLKQTTAVVVDAFLNGTDIVFDALFDALPAVAEAALKSLSNPVYIPVISDILEDVFGDSGEFTWLEFVLMCGAIPGTLAYKSMAGSMPFHSGDGFTDEIQATDTLDGFLQQLPKTPSTPANSAFADFRVLDAGNGQDNSGNDGKPKDGDVEAINALMAAKLQGTPAEALFVVCHTAAGVAQWIKAELMPASSTEGAVPGLRVFTTALGAVSSLSLAASAMLSPRDPIENETFAALRKVAMLLLCSSRAFFLIAGPGKAKAVVDAILCVFQLVPTSYHLRVLGSEPAGHDRSAAYIDEVTTIANCFSRLGQDVYQIATDPDTKAGALTAAVAGCYSAAGLEFANAGVIGSG